MRRFGRAAVGLVAAAGGSGLPGLLTGPAPWPRNAEQLGARLAALGLPALTQEGSALHVHQHLDVFVNGRRVRVPAGIGIDLAEQFISPLHTHDPSGVIHVESPTARPFTLGQFFGVWGVRFTPSCLGGYCGELRVFVNGRPLRGDPTRLVLAPHQEIVVSVGRPPRRVPRSYPFLAGL